VCLCTRTTGNHNAFAAYYWQQRHKDRLARQKIKVVVLVLNNDEKAWEQLRVIQLTC